MVVRDRQELGFPIGEPAFGGGTLALGTVLVTTRVIGNLLRGAAIATQYVATERGAAAALDGRHGPELTEADMSCVVLPPRRPVVAEDVRDLPRRPAHGRGSVQGLRIQILQGAFDLAQQTRCHLAVAGGILELFVAEQDLDDADILVVLEQVCGERMP